MSKATRQTITLLIVIGGLLDGMDKGRMFSATYMREHIARTRDLAIETASRWPSSGNGFANNAWIQSKVDAWANHIVAVPEYDKVGVFAAVCEQCLSDIRTKTRDTKKLALLDPLREPLRRIFEFTDPTYTNFAVYAKADELMQYIYKLIEWEW